MVITTVQKLDEILAAMKKAAETKEVDDWEHVAELYVAMLEMNDQ